MNGMGIIAHHGYAMTAIILFLASLGMPLPVALSLLAAGAATHDGLSPIAVLAVAWAAAMAGDVLLYLGGKHTGWWLLAGLCRLSLNPEQCVFTSADSFYKRGPQTLLIAKFVPGLAMIAAPLAGSLNMRWQRFLWLMGAGEMLYCSVWLGLGYIFFRYVADVARWVEGASHAVLTAVLLLAAGYVLMLIVFTLQARRFRHIEKISAAGLQERLELLDPNRLVIIADVRSHNYYDPGMQRIKNSIRVEPNRLHDELLALREFMAPECEIYLYCSCIRDTTSVRVAHALREADCAATVIEGGLKAWVKAGGEVELVPAGDVHHLPQFD
jgi:membrane protein DedA with SNARE-associated domain/rhodanese-related sulfurtransferase